jgi:hypothetical protein
MRTIEALSVMHYIKTHFSPSIENEKINKNRNCSFSRLVSHMFAEGSPVKHQFLAPKTVS